MFKRFSLLSACILLLTTAAGAAELTKVGSGGELIGGGAGDLPAALKEGDRIKGPASITSAAGDLILLGKDAVVQVSAPSGDVEFFTLEQGWAQGEVSGRTTISLPAGRLMGPDEGKAEFYAENLGPGRGLYRVNSGMAKVLYSVFSIDLGAEHAIELTADRAENRILDFKTLPGNPDVVRIVARISETVEVDVFAPRATIGRVEPWADGSKTRISSDLGSWQGAPIRIETRPVGGGGKTGNLGPGTFAIIDNLTGEIEFGFIEVDFAIIERAISLTSEFALLAVSNFFGLEDLGG